MSNIENLKKQAKQILRWHREKRWAVATDIRNALPEFAGLTDREVFARPFKLTDAQAILAKRHGYESWQALSAALAENTAPQPPSTAAEASSKVSYALPFLYVRDLRAALAFYAGRLGFQTEFAYGEPPFYAQVIRDGVRLALKHADDALIDAMQPFRAEGDEFIAASISLDRAQPLYLEYEAAGVHFRQTLRRESWGAWSFIVEDPDGNLLVFAGMGEHALTTDA